MRSIVGEIVNESTELTLMDMEASIEHLSRGTVRHIDKLLVVIEPYYRALETAGRIVPLARSLGINNLYAIANKLRGARDEEAVTAYCQSHELEPIAMIPFDESVIEADRLGRAVMDYDASAPIVQELSRVVEFFQREA